MDSNVEISAKSEVFEGYIEYLSDKKIAGWAARVGDLNPVVVQILHKDIVIGHVTADIVRQDLKDSGKGTGGHSFVFYFPKIIGEYYQTDRVKVRIRGTSHFLRPVANLHAELTNLRLHSDESLELCDSIQTVSDVHSSDTERADNSSFAAGSSDTGSHNEHISGVTHSSSEVADVINASFQGAFIGIYNMKLIGWAKLADNRTLVLVTVDGKILGETSASGNLVDAPSTLDPKAATYGFELPVPAAMMSDVERKVALYDAGTGSRIAVSADKLWFPRLGDRSAKELLLEATVTKPHMLKPIQPNLIKPEIPPIPKAGKAFQYPSLSGPDSVRRVAVVAWDMAHNPVGRAFLLADLAGQAFEVELVGPTFSFYGGKIWPPISDSDIPLKTFPSNDMKTLVAGALELSSTTKCDAVIVSKPRLSSLLIGALIRYNNDCPMIIDIDDHELSFVKDKTPATYQDILNAIKDHVSEIDVPYSDLWTRFSETLISEADGIIVSNVALREKFGGIIVRHARNEHKFNASLYDREKVRSEFGYNEQDRVILFLGTPRVHKGIFELADSLERLNDPKLALCVIGTMTDKRLLSRFAAYKNARIALHPDQPWERLPELVNMADQTAILQDPKHPIAEFQIPAKLTDSLALDVPILATLVPPLNDLAYSGAFEIVRDGDDLDLALKRLSDGESKRLGAGRGRDAFLTEFSYSVNHARLSLAIEAAKTGRRRDFPGFEKLFRLLEQRTYIELPRLSDSPPRKDRRTPLRPEDKPRDLIFLWKQNDSDIYGRRSDMISKYLLKTGRVRRVIHFDAPISASDLEKQAFQSDGETANQGNLVYVNTVRRILRTADTPNFFRRTYLHRSGKRQERAFGRDLPPRDDYPDFIRKVLTELNVKEAPILWVSPVVFDYQMIADIARPAFILADIIDDQRTFPGDSEEHRQRIAGAYETILNDADAVLSNCEPVCDAFASLRSDIKVIPNGTELLPDVTQWAPPAELANLPRPIIGYVGNLRDRIDLELIEALARRYTMGTIVLIGSAHGRPEVPAMADRQPNIKLLGVKPYEEAQRIMRGFDVAVMPHLKNDQSNRMNPLKLYVYFSVGVPVVTTEVANIGDLAPFINVASDHLSFFQAVDAVLSGLGNAVSDLDRQTILSKLSWEKRLADVWQHLEQVI